MASPISPQPVTEPGRGDLPAYVSNGLMGLRILDIPLLPGVVLVSGFTGMHPEVQVDAAAQAPYPIAGDIGLGKVWLHGAPQQAEFLEQRYDFATGELTTRFSFRTDGTHAEIEVLTFCSQKQPTIVVQEIAIEVNESCELALRSLVDISKVLGRVWRRDLVPPGAGEPAADGSLAWESVSGESRCGIAYVTEFLGDAEAQRKVLDWGLESTLATQYTLRARPGRRYRLRQLASLVPSALHQDPDREATRLVCRAAADGFESLRQENRTEWAEHWKGRIVIDSDDRRWQQLADAAFFYLNSSVHPSAPSSTSMYGLAQWNDYHYYYGHVMWDIDFFCVPPLMVLQPEAARSLLEYRVQTVPAARKNAKLFGRRGIQFAWESGPRTGEESAPGTGKAAWYEDHVSPDVAWAFAQYAHATGDHRFLAEKAAPILYGVADWITSRVTRERDGFSLRKTMGIAERKRASDNDAFTIMGARTTLTEALACAERLGNYAPPAWREVLNGLRLPRNTRTGAIISHDGYRPNEEKGATPGPLAGIFPLGYVLDADTERATIEYYLRLSAEYIGSPMLSPLYGVWAAWIGDRRQALRLLDDGYAQLMGDRFMQTLEMSPKKFPDQPSSGPFFANLAGFLMALLFGFPGLRIGAGDPETWAARPVVLPQGWRSIEVERVWVRTQPARLVARHGADRATIQLNRPSRRRAA
jgi:protein-glucosylgalactosylhydroxylysine glucosidase